MADELRDLAQTIFDQPVTQGPKTQAFIGGIGEALDAQTVLDRQALKARLTDGARMGEVCDQLGVERLPTAGDVERLRRLGAAKGVQRYSTESDAQFEARIDSALADARLLTTVEGIRRQLQAYGVPDVEIIEECYTPLGAPGSAFALRFVVVLGPSFGTLGWAPLTMPFMLGAAVLGIAGMTSAQASDLVRIVLAWKTAAAKPIAVVFRFGDFPVLGCGGLKLPFKLGGSGGGSNGYARRPVGENGALGKHALGGFKLGTAYTV
jgi:hypothetical protein